MGSSDEKPSKPFSGAEGDSDLRRREEMLREYYWAQERVDRYVERRVTVKSWSVTSCGVALGFGLVENSSVLFCLAAFGSLVFWYLEGLWRTRQSILIDRCAILEDMIAKNSKSYVGPEINSAFSRVGNLTDSWPMIEVLRYRSVRVPHFFIFCIGILFFIGSILKLKLPIFMSS
jgi:hypothetical protein